MHVETLALFSARDGRGVVERTRPTRRDRGGIRRFGQYTTVFVTCGGLDSGRGVERRLWACTSFRLSGGGASTFSAGVAGT